MGRKGKRKYDSHDGKSSVSYNSKRHRNSFDDEDGMTSQSHTQGKLDPTFGQRSAIPGLDDYSRVEYEDGELDYGDDEDENALSYLRSVR